jgi:hypothetical protein
VLLARDPAHLVDHVVSAVVHRVVDPDGADRVVLGRRCGAVHLGPDQLRQLGGSDADSTGGGLDQDALALSQASVADQAGVRRCVCHR